MEYRITNDKLEAVLSDFGGAVLSVKDSMDHEYMWQGDPMYWDGRSFSIFPYVGRLTDETYTLDGRSYQMGIHGFILNAKMQAVKEEREAISFKLQSNSETQPMYPFYFTYWQHYRLMGNALKVTYEVKNLGTETMYFGFGAHPAFNVPLREGLHFEDYYLQFDSDCAPMEIVMTPDCFVSGDERPFALHNGRLPLRHQLFDNDAIILKNPGSGVTLKCDQDGGGSIRVSCEDFPYLTLWSMPHVCAPYLCIEPVSSLPAHKGVIEDLSKQQDLISLPAKETYRVSTSFRFDGGER